MVAEKVIEEAKQKSCVYPADNIVNNSSVTMMNFFVEVTRWPDFHYVEEAEKNKQDKKLQEIVFANEEPSDTHSQNFIDDYPLRIMNL